MTLCMFTSEKILHCEPAELLGDWHPLVSQLGSTEGLVEFAAVAQRFLDRGFPAAAS
jgi:hypothetical protein